MTTNFERTKNPKESLGIGTVSKIKKILTDSNGIIIPYDSYIALDIFKYINNYNVCVVIHADGSNLIIENSHIGKWRATLDDLLTYLNNNNFHQSSDIDTSSMYGEIF